MELNVFDGILTQVRDYKIDDVWQDNMVDSNKEHGESRSDVVVCDTINGHVAIFESKRARSVDELESECEKALRQIDERMYARDFEDEYDSDHIHCYGIAFYKKRCLVKKK